jgi:hypothetical protein
MERRPHVRASLTISLLAAALCASASTGFAADAAPAPTAGSHNGGIVGFGAMTGTVFQEGQSSFSGISMRLRIRNAALRPNVELLPTMEYWQNTSHLDAFDIRTRRRDATLGGDVRWVFDSKKAWRPYIGTGFALHFLDDQLDAPRLGVPKTSTGVVRGGLAALGGLEFNLDSRIGSFLELKYHNVPHYRQLKFNTGLAWNF